VIRAEVGIWTGLDGNEAVKAGASNSDQKIVILKNKSAWKSRHEWDCLSEQRNSADVNVLHSAQEVIHFVRHRTVYERERRVVVGIPLIALDMAASIEIRIGRNGKISCIVCRPIYYEF